MQANVDAAQAFWSGVDLTGNQTGEVVFGNEPEFWSGVDLTGNQTEIRSHHNHLEFWSGVDLTGNQTNTLVFTVHT